MANGLCSSPLISTPFWAKRYVPLSVALEHVAPASFSSLANPLPTASTPTRPTTPNTINRAARYLFMRSVPPCFVGAYDRISVSTAASSRAGPHIRSAAYSCERGRRITQRSDFCRCLNVAYRHELLRTPLWRSSKNPPYTTLWENCAITGSCLYWGGVCTDLFAPIMDSASSSVSSSCFWSQRLPTSSF